MYVSYLAYVIKVQHASVQGQNALQELMSGVATVDVMDDRTLTDEVADHRFMMPTPAGEIVPERAALEREFDQLSTTLNTAYQMNVVNQLTAHATALDNAYQSAVTARLQETELLILRVDSKLHIRRFNKRKNTKKSSKRPSRKCVMRWKQRPKRRSKRHNDDTV